MEQETGTIGNERIESNEKPIVINILDTIYSQIDVDSIEMLKSILTFKSFFWKPGKYKKTRMEYDKCLITKTGLFHTGLIPYIRKNLNVPVIVKEHSDLKRLYKNEIDIPELKGIIFRNDQKRILDNAIKKKRGIIISPTASGKGIIICGLVSAFKRKHKILILIHNKSLLRQISDDFKRFGFEHTIMFGEAKEGLSPLTIATIQTFSKLDANKYSSYFDVIIQDETHFCSSYSTIYAKTLLNMIAPYRYGLTATVKTNKEGVLVANSCFGEVIDEVTMEEGIEEGFIAKPKLKILKSEYSHYVHELRRYADVYDEGIVHNNQRNQMIADFVEEQRLKENTCLILVNKIEHGISLKHIIPNSFFVRGTTETEVREEIKRNLNSKDIQCVIATAVWKTGINIPSINVVINAGGGKSEISTIQSAGRGLRVTDTKKDVLIVDIFDNSHNYLVSHFGDRISLYCSLGWL